MKNRIIPFLATFFGSICFGLLFIVIFVNATQVNCIRQPAGMYTCQLRTLFLGIFSHPIVSSKTSRASTLQIVKTRTVSRTKRSLPQPAAVRFRSATIWTDYGPVSQQVTAIRSQMTSGEDQIQYTADPPWWVLFLVGGLVIMVLLLSPLFFTRR